MANPSETQTLLKKTAKDSLIYLPSMVMPAVLGVVLLRVFTTIFSHEEYGYYNIALSTIGLIKVFSVVWLSSSALRFYLKYKKNEQQQSFMSSLFFASLAGALFVSGLAFFVVNVFLPSIIDNSLIRILNITILAAVFTSVFEVFIVLFRSGMQASKYSLYWIIYVVGKPLIGILLILFAGFRVEAIFIGFLITPLVLNFFMFQNLGAFSDIRPRYFSKTFLSEFAKYGIPILFSNLSFWILSLSDRYLIEYFKGSSQVGLYGLGYAIPEKTLQFTFTTLMLAAYPVIVENWEKKEGSSTQELISAMSRYYLLIITPIYLILATIPQEILLVFASAKFIEGAKVIPFVATALYFFGLSQYAQKGLELKKKSIKIAVAAFIAGITNILFNLFLIPKYGYWGAGFSSALAYFVYLFSICLLVRKELAWKIPIKTVLRVAVASVCLIVTLKMTVDIFDILIIKVLVSTFVGAIVYTAILLISAEIKKNELAYITSFVKRITRR